MSNKVLDTNYFKKVTDFGKNVFKSEMNNTGATYNIFDFVVNNVIALILIFIIFSIILWAFSFYQNKKKIKASKTISDSFQHGQLDNTEELTVSANNIKPPKQISKYSFTFNLLINDFYCYKGKWKCIMLKGINMSNYEPKECSDFPLRGELNNINRNISPSSCFKFVCNDELNELNNTLHNSKELEERVDPDDINKRVDLICRATKMGREGKDLLACGMSKCKLMEKDMLRGHANSFIDAHKEYCNKVYIGENKVEKDTNKRYDDGADNVCSNKILIEKYPHLIPRDLTKFLASKKLDRNNLEKYDDITAVHEQDFTSETIESCWDDVISNLPIQAPGVWLHPYVNNMRIVLTTYSTKEFDKDNFNFSHSHDKTSFTDSKYNITRINNNLVCDEHPNVTRYAPSCSTVAEKTNTRSENVYREFFDIENIPIKELFHLALVINENACEVYFSGKLVKTQILFGEPRYNKGDLYLNHKGNLNGSLMDFKFIPHTLTQQNILSLLREKPMIQDGEVTGIKIDKEHQHDFKFVHTHKFEHNTEGEHNHTLEEQDVDTNYFVQE